MNAARDGLEVVYRERPRVEEAVPADDVERVVVEDVVLNSAADAHLHDELAGLPARRELGRRVDVAVVVGSALEDLAVLVPVPARDLDEPGRLEDQVALRALWDEPIRRPARDDDVVPVLVRDVAENRLESSRALVDEDHLVALAVPEEVVHARLRAAERDLDVRVPHQRAAPADLVALRLDVVRVHASMSVRLGHPFLALDRRERAELFHTAR